MVRHKARWMLARLDFSQQQTASDSNTKSGRSAAFFPTRKDFTRATQDNIIACFGMAASAASVEVQVRFCDVSTSLVLLRVSRENYALVRASLTLMTTMPVSSVDDDADLPGTFSQQPRAVVPVVVSVISAHGSARTAKRATMQYIRNQYRLFVEDLRKRQDTTPTSRDNKRIDRVCRAMEERLLEIQNLD